MSERTYLYGFGSKKHIAASDESASRWDLKEPSLCGGFFYSEAELFRGYSDPPIDEWRGLPVCKRCEKKAVQP